MKEYKGDSGNAIHLSVGRRGSWQAGEGVPASCAWHAKPVVGSVHEGTGQLGGSSGSEQLHE